MERLRKKPEILAPAGSIESLKGALCAGADAVYIGGSRFGARAYADNPEADMLLEAIDYVHSKDKRIYLTVNTLLKNRELTKDLVPFLEKYYRAGLDAVIVQDVGVLHFLAKEFPDLPVHASTQMTIVSPDGANMLSEYPVTRVVPARELSLAEIKNIREHTNLEIEAFVHGALCYCYSGQCLFSSMIGGRSGNRGRCAQPCRMAYTVAEDGKKQSDGLYVLSPKDLCTLDQIPELVKAGIDSFKIEGRMKRPEYTAGVTAAYRLMTDLYFEQGEEGFQQYLKKNPDILTEQMDRMTDLYNRGGFTKGYYVQYHGRSMMSMERPNHSGTPVGEVTKVQGIRATIKLTKPLYPQDILEIRPEKGEAYEFTTGKAGIEEKPGFYETNVKKGFPVKPGLFVYRTKNEQLLTELREGYVEKLFQLPVDGEFTAIPGMPATLTVSLSAHGKSSLIPGADEKLVREVEVTVTGDEVMEAKNQPVSADKIKEQLSKTGESVYYFENLAINTNEKTFLPMGKIKELRRTAFEQLQEEVVKGYRRESAAVAISRQEDNATTDADFQTVSEIIALVSTEEQLHAVLSEERVSTVYVDMQNLSMEQQLDLCKKGKEAQKKAFLVLPHIFRKKEKERYLIKTELLRNGSFDGFLVKSLEELAFLQESGLDKVFEIRLNYNLYTFQEQAKEFFRGRGYRRFTVPVELNEEEIKELSLEDSDFILYGRLPLMVSAQCVRDNVLHCSSGMKTEGITLTDRMGAEFPVRQICTSCYNVIYNSACTSLLGMGVEEMFSPAGWRFDFTFEGEQEVKQVFECFFAGKDGGQNASFCGKGPYTKGHFKRGVE